MVISRPLLRGKIYDKNWTHIKKSGSFFKCLTMIFSDTLPVMIDYDLIEILDIIPDVVNQYNISLRSAWQQAAMQIF